MTIGGSVGARSSIGAQLDRASLYAHRARPCTMCGGDVAKGRSGRGTIWPAGSGARHARALQAEAEVAACLGLDPADPANLDPGLLGESCPGCDGRGWVVDPRARHDSTDPLTARPTGSSRQPWTGCGDSDDAETLALLGVVSRRLAALPERLADVLRCFYLPSPVRESPRAVWPLVPAGKTLLKQSHASVGPWQAIETLLQAQADRPTATRAQQIATANAQAEALISEAVEAWALLVRAEVQSQAATLLGEVVR